MPTPDDAGPQEGNSSLFAVFALSLLSLVLFPYTFAKLAALSAPPTDVRPWETGKKQPSRLRALASALFSRRAALLWLLWAVWLALVLVSRDAAGDATPFDPWDILKLERSATPADVKRAYRKMSLIYHPDKNPDPEATKYFAESVTKAYKALTDDASRENYEKYGHPDGPQGMRMNIALPEWVFASDAKTAPALLAVLVAGGILAPLLAACYFWWRDSTAVGIRDVAPETVEMFVRSKWGVKEAQTVRGVQDTLVMAWEFITLPFGRHQGPALAVAARGVGDARPDVKEKGAWWKRRPSVLKSECVFILHCAREPAPPQLASDASFHLAKATVLLDEMVKIAAAPRAAAWRYGWLAPTLGCIEFMQCLNAGISPMVRRPAPGKALAADPGLLGLPHLDADAAKRLARRGVKSVAALLAASPSERAVALAEAGLGMAATADVESALTAMPRLTAAAGAARVDGADGDARPGDVVTVSCSVLLTRAAHGLPGASPPEGKVAVFAPHAGRRVTERWWVVVGDAALNTVFAVSPVDLTAAESASFTPGLHDGLRAAAGAGDAAAVAALVTATGAVVSISFDCPPRPGTYDLAMYLLCDGVVGADAAVPVRLRVADVSRAEREGRAGPAQGGVGASEDGGGADSDAPPSARGSDESDASDDGSDADSDEREWDSEETGTEASSDDEAVVAYAERQRARAAAKKGGGGGGAEVAADAGTAAPVAGGGEIEAAQD